MFYQPEEILREVEEKIQKVRILGESIDYLTFVPDGEPTLDINLGREIELLKPLGIRIAVITNASLIWRPDVREDLMKADWISLKVDSVDDKIWQRINRPHGALQLNTILSGMLEFARAYRGDLVTETMLVMGVSDSDDNIKKTADFVAQLRPAKAYISIPTRPPTERWVKSPDEKTINKAYQIFSNKIQSAECLIGYEGNVFAFTGNIEEDLLSITSVHPMREEAVKELLVKAKANWSIVQSLIDQGLLIEIEYEGNKFYMRRLNRTYKL
jgi:wyosine [tRNA(Phe)-imidazoG37] synthetase (radical SAM superfamily)